MATPTPTTTTPHPPTPEEAKATLGDAEVTRNQLAKFEACALKSPNPNATRRFKLEFELDQMQATDDAFFDFWVECVHLAVTNMQATRLQYLQLRVEKLENPDAPPLGAVLLSMAASLLEQLVVVGVIELAAGTAIAVGGWFAYQCAASRIASGLKVAQVAAADAEILSLNAAKKSLERNAEFLRNVQTSALLGPASADRLTLQLPGNQEIQFSPRDRQSITQA